MTEHGRNPMVEHGRSPMKSNLEGDRKYIRSSPLPWIIQEKYIDEETEALSNEGRKNLNEMYEVNQTFNDEIINFVGDKSELDREKILDKRFKYNTLNKLGLKLWPSLPSL